MYIGYITAVSTNHMHTDTHTGYTQTQINTRIDKQINKCMCACAHVWCLSRCLKA